MQETLKILLNTSLSKLKIYLPSKKEATITPVFKYVIRTDNVALSSTSNPLVNRVSK